MNNSKENKQHTPASSVSRKTFLKQSSLSVLGLGLLSFGRSALAFGKIQEQSTPKAKYHGDEKKLRTITYNVFNGAIGYKGINGRDLPDNEDSALVKRARDMGQIPKRIMMELALYQPDLINFSESPYEGVVEAMAQMLNLNYAFFPGAKNGKGHFPGSVLTHYEIISQETRPFVNKAENDPEDLFTRHWGKAKLRLPNGTILTIHSAHLWPFAKESKDTEIRLREIEELLKGINYDLDNGSDSVLLQGDLNHMPDTPEYERLKDGGVIDVFKAAGTGEGYTHSAIKPGKRIDFIYAAGSLSKQIELCRPLFEGDFRTNNDDPKSFALSDHLPVMADFKLS